MSSKKLNTLLLAGMVASMNAENSYAQYNREVQDIIDDVDGDIKSYSPSRGKVKSHFLRGLSKMTEQERKEKDGLKKFYFGQNYVYAINEKNAIKKAKNLGYV